VLKTAGLERIGQLYRGTRPFHIDGHLRFRLGLKIINCRQMKKMVDVAA
jgi:hypothetical protein